jgi:predicted metal-dependent phosphoesterase TrpH
MLYDIHVHSCFSDGAATPSEIVAHAKKIGLNGIALTDHNEVKGALEALKYNSPEFMVIPGIEVSSKEGHILGLEVTEIVPRGLSAEETIERIHDLGGIAIAAHPFDRLRQGVGYLAFELDFDAVEVFNGHTMLTIKGPDQVLKELEGIPAVGGSDAHLLCELGSVVVKADGDVIEQIVKGEVDVSVNISRTRIIFNHLKRKIAKRRF